MARWPEETRQQRQVAQLLQEAEPEQVTKHQTKIVMHGQSLGQDFGNHLKHVLEQILRQEQTRFAHQQAFDQRLALKALHHAHRAPEHRDLERHATSQPHRLPQSVCHFDVNARCPRLPPTSNQHSMTSNHYIKTIKHKFNHQ
jgi:hypothetical protein